jgi:hypothetical protein
MLVALVDKFLDKPHHDPSEGQTAIRGDIIQLSTKLLVALESKVLVIKLFYVIIPSTRLDLLAAVPERSLRHPVLSDQLLLHLSGTF